MRLLVFEPDFEGHRLHYVARLLVALGRLAPLRVVAVLPRAAAISAEYHVHLRPLEGQFDLDFSLTREWSSSLQYATHVAASLPRMIRRHRPDHLYVPYADGLSQVLGVVRLLGGDVLPPGLHGEALLMRGGRFYPHASAAQALRRRILWEASLRAPWARLHHLDPLVVTAARRSGGRGRLLHLMPEAVEQAAVISRKAARQSLGLPDEGLVLGSVGVQDERKGIDLLIRAFFDADAQGMISSQTRLLLPGRQSPGVRELLRGAAARLLAAGRIIAPDRYVDHDEFTASLAAMDVVCTPYPRHIGSASIVVHAAHAGRPVLASDFGWCGYIVPRFELGWVTNVLDRDRFAKALAKALHEAPMFRPSPAAQRFIRFHTLANFEAAWTEGLRRRLELPAAPGRVSWEWALCGSSEASATQSPSPVKAHEQR